MTRDEVVEVPSRYEPTSPSPKGDQVKRMVAHLRSLQLNKAIYLEASTFFFDSSPIFFDLTYGQIRSVTEVPLFFTAMLPTSRLAIRNLGLGLDRKHILSGVWKTTCAYLAKETALRELRICMVHGSNHHYPCSGQCVSDLSNLDTRWARALSRIRGLRVFALHTDWCGWGCGFDGDGIFDQSRVRDADGEEGLLCCTVYPECFKREFVEGLRAKMVMVEVAAVERQGPGFESWVLGGRR